MADEQTGALLREVRAGQQEQLALYRVRARPALRAPQARRVGSAKQRACGALSSA